MLNTEESQPLPTHISIGDLANVMQAIKTLVHQLPYDDSVIETDTGRVPVTATLYALVDTADRAVVSLMEEGISHA